MSIYATLWTLQFPRYGDLLIAQDWIEVWAQGVPGHIGSPSPGCGYEDGDPYADFLPPAVACEGDDAPLRAVVFVTSKTKKGTARSAQEYADPLLVLSGDEYARSGFTELHERLCDALRAGRPRGILQVLSPDGTVRVLYEDGSERIVHAPDRL